MQDTSFDPLQALSEARTALTDPGALEGIPDQDAVASGAFAIDRIDQAIGALYYEPANDARDEAVWVLTHLGRLLARVADELPSDMSPAAFDTAADLIVQAGDRIDEAIDLLSHPREDD